MEERLTMRDVGGAGTAPPLVSLRGAHKHFGGVRALRDVSVDIAVGSVHALVGENGAGKSTLGKIVGGVLQLDGGELRVSGEPVRFAAPRQALSAGIAVIAQELALVGDATVLENVFLGIERHRASVVQQAPMRQRFAELLELCEFHGLSADARVGGLNVADQQKVEILRAIARDARLIVMDEPTARLSGDEALHLRRAIARLRDRGTTVVYVSHFLSEVLAVADTVTVLRDGGLVGTLPAADLDVDRLAEMMVGRAVLLERAADHRTDPPSGAPCLAVEGLARGGRFADVSFAVRPGEILAITGLVGAGRSEVAHAIFGSAPADAGTVWLHGERFDRRSPPASLRRGLALVPESRKDQGLVMTDSVLENISGATLARVSAHGILRKRAERRRALEVADRVGLDRGLLTRPVSLLSGGNQQKVLFAKWLVAEPSVLVVDEPTRGVDVGAKESIYELLRGAAHAGAGVVVISSEIEEVLSLADRVLVMRRGRIVAELTGDDIAEDPITRAGLGASSLREEAA
ncbi:MAG TPA: sugar ABC transporter ATP-binding protein [Baekduia sp.]|uniref:sugar ABC transporter ATP-binding protein n=1 Tax=Baekduia sp. TaxID=2600305 RepID=UPI002D79ED9D|nr:sugar ABC transporter ATP-binding protein [Baekduia sp.]HET6509091.1 sugar ABC transporter ATP-binding protein [Baekduia sp.]